MATVFNFLNDDETIKLAGFANGFVYEMNKNNLLEAPWTSVLHSSFYGFLTMCGASFVSSWLPPNLRCVIPIAVSVSCVYYVCNKPKEDSVLTISPTQWLRLNCKNVTIDNNCCDATIQGGEGNRGCGTNPTINDYCSSSCTPVNHNAKCNRCNENPCNCADYW